MIFNKILMRILLKRGYSYTSAQIVLKTMETDKKMIPNLNPLIRLKCYLGGFSVLSGYFLSKYVQKDYFVPEFKYYKLHPINGRYSMWIDDKLTMRFMLEPFKEYLPKYYFQVDKKKLIALPDLPNNISTDYDGFFDLLNQNGTLAAKPFIGSGGAGFLKLEIKNNEYLVNNKIYTKNELVQFVNSLEDYIVTEFIISEDKLRDINPYSTNTVRLIVTHMHDQVHFIGAFLRIGTKVSGTVDNLSLGGCLTRVNCQTGEIISPTVYGNAEHNGMGDKHPDTNVSITGALKNWDLITIQINKICEYLPQLIYMGFDIAITNEGFKIVEINSLQALINGSLFFGEEPSDEYKAFFKEIMNGNKANVRD